MGPIPVSRATGKMVNNQWYSPPESTWQSGENTFPSQNAVMSLELEANVPAANVVLAKKFSKTDFVVMF